MSQDNRLILLEDISKDFDRHTVLSDINLYIKKNEFLTLLGPSGCGKTTMLRIIGGFEFPTTGRVLFDGKDITDEPPYKRRVNTVFQKYALFPHLNVFENIAFGLKIAKLPKAEITSRVGKMLELVNLLGYEKRSVDSLSGGQQQRIAIARALVNEPEVLLLDEPLAALDYKLRKGMQLELKRMQQVLGITFIFVTHDQEEALTMSDTIVVMKDGFMRQIGTPKHIYDEPKDAFVANFIGESNIIRGIMPKDEVVHFCGLNFECVDSGFEKDEPVNVLIRPEDIVITDAEDVPLKGVVRSVIFKGVHYEMVIDAGNYLWKVHSTVMVPENSKVGLSVVPFNIHVMKLTDDELTGDEQ
ncbi:MAG: ABC transporter ATP-binding protein [Christensenellales bacterium]|jgi:spermidine/putrescine transport system ATP-binding protein|nr:ABC transporter ATP-binding protein [Christensenellaceae bacterium]